MSNKILAMFPGQGSQYVGMARILLEEFQIARRVFEEAEDACKLPLRKLCLDGPEADLTLTEHTQPAILTTSVATWKVITEETDFLPDYYAGHSLGEYSALVAAGKIKLFDAAKIVRTRGAEMQKAVPVGKGAMLAVLGGIEIPVLEALCLEVTESLVRNGLNEWEASVQIANYNSVSQLILSGGVHAVTLAQEKLAGLGSKTKLLAVSAPFHSRLMKPARVAMEPLLRSLPLSDSSGQVIANTSGKVEHPYRTDLLVEQIDGAVRWNQSIELALTLGVQKFVEIGPGKVLTGLIKRSIPKESISLTSDDIKDILTKINHGS